MNHTDLLQSVLFSLILIIHSSTAAVPGTQQPSLPENKQASEAYRTASDLPSLSSPTEPIPQFHPQLCRDLNAVTSLQSLLPFQGTKNILIEHLIFLRSLDLLGVSPQPISIPMTKLPIPRNTFYQESPLATLSSISGKKSL